MEVSKKINSAFAKDVFSGLTAEKKYLSSMYFYDEKGSEIFEQIMRMPTYYLTDCEYEIFNNSSEALISDFKNGGTEFSLLELGAGDGYKTKVLLKNLLENNVDFNYSPIDISSSAVEKLTEDLVNEFPNLKVKGLTGDYFKLLDDFKNSGKRKIMLFLGSNIGNFNQPLAAEFLQKLRDASNAGDLLLIGFDLKKDKQIIMDAYDDKWGITAEFNLNLLRRINLELDADFQLENFKHLETYDEKSGRAESFLLSKKAQSVYIAGIDLKIDFKDGETIYTEMSQKYDIKMIENLAENCGYKIVRNYTDQRQYFMNSLWEI